MKLFLIGVILCLSHSAFANGRIWQCKNGNGMSATLRGMQQFARVSSADIELPDGSKLRFSDEQKIVDRPVQIFESGNNSILFVPEENFLPMMESKAQLLVFKKELPSQIQLPILIEKLDCVGN